MNNKPWLPYINLVTFVFLLFLCLFLIYLSFEIFVGFTGGEIGIGLVPLFIEKSPAVIILVSIVIIGFLAVFLYNFSAAQKNMSGWTLLLVAALLFIPAAFCSIGIAFFISFLSSFKGGGGGSF